MYYCKQKCSTLNKMNYYNGLELELGINNEQKNTSKNRLL